MKNLARGSANLRLPSMFILPYDLKSSYCECGLDFGGKKNFMIIGTGDFIFPAVLAVSVWLRTQNTFAVCAISLGIILAYSLMFLMLRYYPDKFRLLPGLPFLCSGAILGLVIFNLTTG
jgi:presenilin-like A22 family membrane protease